MRHWLARGIDGWRLDAAYSVPTDFWARVLPAVRRDHPRAWFLGEVIHGDYAAIVKDSTMDTLTQYELWKAIWSSLTDTNFFELDWNLTRHNAFLDSFTPQTFTGNHDVTCIASGLAKDGDWAGVEADIRAVVAAVDGKALVKVILEICLLTEEEIRKACACALEAGADFVKTSTGFSTGGATVEAVRLMRECVGNKMGVKASGGVRTARNWRGPRRRRHGRGPRRRCRSRRDRRAHV